MKRLLPLVGKIMNIMVKCMGPMHSLPTACDWNGPEYLYKQSEEVRE